MTGQTKTKAKPTKATGASSNGKQQQPKIHEKAYPANDGPITVQFFVLFMALPYLIGFFVSKSNIEMAHSVLDKLVGGFGGAASSADVVTKPASEQHQRKLLDVDGCYERIMVNMFQGLHAKRRDDPFGDVDVFLHRNGESTACGDTTASTTHNNNKLEDALKGLLSTLDECPHFQLDHKYQAENFMTRLFHYMFADTCPSTEPERSASEGLYGFCDMGESKTPILLDHGQLRSIKSSSGTTTYLPCHFHTFHGIRVKSLAELAEVARRAPAPDINTTDEEECETLPDGTTTCGAATDAATTPERRRRQLHLYAVPAGRVFIFAPNYVGEIIPLDHVTGGDGTKPVYLQVLSLQPRVFDLVNFFSKTESEDLVTRALAETTESHRIKRSSTGAVGYNLNKHRTSESGYDTSGATAVAIKKRCFSVLGFDHYIESHADGLQILRYNLTTAYNTHMDWIDGSDQLEHDFDSAGKGGNRFATIFLYMSDLGEHDGGETVFSEAWPPNQAEEDHVQLNQAIQQLRESGDGEALQEGSWEETLVATCRSRLSVRPSSARSILFYSQKPNGEPDRDSLHGGCPVLKGTKWGSNLWVWNTPRQGYSGAPRNPNYKGPETKPPKSGAVAVFRNQGGDPDMENAELYFQEQWWGKLGPNDPPISVNTYPGHHWRVVVDGKEVYSWTIDKDEGELYFEV